MKTLPAFRSLRQSLWPRSHDPRPLDWELVDRILEASEALKKADDSAVAERTTQLRSRVRSGESILSTEILVDAFASAAEAIRRTLGFTYYKVQLVAGLALSTGAIAEMKTGEGKTIVALLPATLHALNGKGVHVATVNSYLAERDFELLAPAYELLGFTIGFTKDQDLPANKRRAYECDITYGTGYEFGFDYLRDQAALRNTPKQKLGETFRGRLRGDVSHTSRICQRGHSFAVIDEVDSVLIDEANTPLVLSADPGGKEVDETPFQRAMEVADLLQDGEHYVVDNRRRTIDLTERGQSLVFESHTARPVDGLYRPWQNYVEQALRAKLLLKRDTDYVVQEEGVRIVDHYTGRIFTDRTWRDGLHQAVEIKEGLPITGEKSSLGRVSRQRYFGLYDSICGMTGTATGHERELQEFYKLPIVVIPERLPSQRSAEKARYFQTQEAKWNAIVEDIRRRHKSGQPVLVGTRTIDESEEISRLLKNAKVPHQVLNGLQTEGEADLVGRAGQRGSITIATNMAGRGTDIALGDGVEALGGLHVVATERQESMRVDRQLIGRSARQGRRGSCQMFVSAEDDLIEQFQPAFAKTMRAAAATEGEIRSDLTGDLDRIQSRAEHHRFQQRADLYRHDQWMNDVLAAVAEKDTHSEDALSPA